ncbi:MAG: rubredoxin-like domain-containing protein [Thermodesulfobacteriota bacterium]
MEKKTERKTEEAFLAASLGEARAEFYQLRAKQDGEAGLAGLFGAMALSRKAQAKRFLHQLRGRIHSTGQNCGLAFDEEVPARVREYERGETIADEGNERAMAGAFSQSARVEKILLSLRKKSDSNGNTPAEYHVCNFCGFVMAGEAPERCPICTAARSRFDQSDP